MLCGSALIILRLIVTMPGDHLRATSQATGHVLAHHLDAFRTVSEQREARDRLTTPPPPPILACGEFFRGEE